MNVIVLGRATLGRAAEIVDIRSDITNTSSNRRIDHDSFLRPSLVISSAISCPNRRRCSSEHEFQTPLHRSVPGCSRNNSECLGDIEIQSRLPKSLQVEQIISLPAKNHLRPLPYLESPHHRDVFRV